METTKMSLAEELRSSCDSLEFLDAADRELMLRAADALERKDAALQGVLDRLECIESADQPPGHVNYLSKSGMCRTASAALTMARDALEGKP